MIHHCNIDRYWECWIRQGGGRAHPGSPWRDEKFPFHSITGRREAMVADGLRTEDLGYTYDTMSCSRSVSWMLPDWVRELQFERLPWRKPPQPDPPPWVEILELSPYTIDGRPTALVVSRAEFRQAGGANARRVAVILHDVVSLSGKDTGGFSLEIALAPDAKRIAMNDFRDVAPVNAFGSFELSVLARHAEHHGSSSLVFELPARALKALSAAGEEFASGVFPARSRRPRRPAAPVRCQTTLVQDRRDAPGGAMKTGECPHYRKSASSATMMRLRPCSFARATATSAAFRNLSAESSGRAVWMATPPLTVTYFWVERG